MSELIEIKVPDIGGATDVDVIEIMVKPGDTVTVDQSLITLEGDKATMDIPSPMAGVVESLKLKLGDKVSQGSVILQLKAAQGEPKAAAPAPAAVAEEPKPEPTPAVVAAEIAVEPEIPPAIEPAQIVPQATSDLVAAGPSVRRLAREFGVDLHLVTGSGRKGRILAEDIQQYVKRRLSEPAGSSTGFGLPAMPVIDFSQFGPTETRALNKIKRLTGQNVHRAWVNIPHVTQFDEADITELEAFRKAQAESLKSADYKLTLLAFVVKVVCKALQAFPQFNASLDSSGENLILKNYFNIGIAVETPQGLVVPVIKAVDQMTVTDIAREMGRLSAKARDKGLSVAEMTGGCFTISSLGGIGGTAFTPIVNAPEVAILGLSRSSLKPVYDGREFQPRLMLPLSLSYDHRVIDGAEGARFTRYLAEALADIRRILL